MATDDRKTFKVPTAGIFQEEAGSLAMPRQPDDVINPKLLWGDNLQTCLCGETIPDTHAWIEHVEGVHRTCWTHEIKLDADGSCPRCEAMRDRREDE